MKKLRLSILNYGDTEVLSREQLKKIMGGGDDGGSGGIILDCVCKGGMPLKCPCSNVRECLDHFCPEGEGGCSAVACP